jgi:hypothetical protein
MATAEDIAAFALVKAGDAAYYDKRWADAVRHYERAIGLSVLIDRAAVMTDCGYALLGLSRVSEAIDWLTRAIELDEPQTAPTPTSPVPIGCRGGARKRLRMPLVRCSSILRTCRHWSSGLLSCAMWDCWPQR